MDGLVERPWLPPKPIDGAKPGKLAFAIPHVGNADDFFEYGRLNDDHQENHRHGPHHQ